MRAFVQVEEEEEEEEAEAELHPGTRRRTSDSRFVPPLMLFGLLGRFARSSARWRVAPRRCSFSSLPFSTRRASAAMARQHPRLIPRELAIRGPGLCPAWTCQWCARLLVCRREAGAGDLGKARQAPSAWLGAELPGCWLRLHRSVWLRARVENARPL